MFAAACRDVPGTTAQGITPLMPVSPAPLPENAVAVMVPAAKPPLASRFTMALAVLALAPASAASCALPTAPLAILADVIAPSATVVADCAVAAIIAYPTAAMRWSGVMSWKPLMPSLNQTRSRTSELLNTVAGTIVMFGSVAFPSSTE